ncbi:Argonaute siRNA chaperone complex subunit Arb1-domain-containing protein [Hypoxylon crocopeplum]|nr:Argonaute siRNA chaperone complex subunit Arb1-domain-containing protein [Hypoxylon crocopeplum]
MSSSTTHDIPKVAGGTMADQPRHSPIKSGERPMQDGVAPPQTNDINMATTLSEVTSGQSDKGLATGSEGDISSPNHEHNESNGNGNTTGALLTPEGASSATVDKPTDATDGGVQVVTESQPKKKKKPRKKVAASRKNITGFEEFYADAPVTPTEAMLEQKEVYSSSRGFPDRIEECLQRYRANRRMDSERTMMFNKYLWLGGIDASPRQFTGFANDRDTLAEADAEGVRQMTATDFVGGSGCRFYNPLEPDDWFVDFEDIVKGFLSRIIPNIYMYDDVANRKAADTVKNFLNYVLMHDVCPEYIENIKAARNICDIAPIELRMVHELLQQLPGAFNAAASSLFCYRLVDKSDEVENFDKLITFRLTVLLAMIDQKIKDELMSTDDPTTIRVINTKEEAYEVVDIIKPRRKDILVIQEELEKAGQAGKANPTGIIKLKPTIIEFGFDNLPRADEVDLSNAESEEYLLEEDLLAKFEKGMKITTVVCELNIGVRFIKEIKDVRVSFDQFLPQMLMENWKDNVPNDRPPPSASSPNTEDKALGGDDL